MLPQPRPDDPFNKVPLMLPPVAAPTGIEFSSRFVAIDSSLADHIAERFGSPVFLIDVPGLEQRFRDFQSAVESQYSNSVVAISYKTNPTIGLLQLLHRHSPWAEVISREEFLLAQHLGVPLNKIVFNGPGKTDDVLHAAVRGDSQINCDHMDEILRVEKAAASMQKQAAIGIRVGLNMGEQFSRFGFALTDPLPESEARFAAEFVHRSPHLALSGIHSQLGTNIRDFEKFGRQTANLASFAMHLKRQHSIDLQWINVGGGLAGIAPEKGTANPSPRLPDVNEYAKAITEPLQDYFESCQRAPALFFEPGRTIFEPFGALLTTVLGRRAARNEARPAAICDAGVSSLPLADRFDFPIHLCTSRPDDASDSRSWDLFGPTCMHRDHLGKTDQQADIQIGDRVLLFGVGGYGLSTASSFIKYRPGVVAWHDAEEFSWLRSPETLEHQLLLQSTTT